MGLRKLGEKLADYNERLESGQASKIKPSDVRKVLTKLHKKRDELEAEIASSESADKTNRLKRKLGIVGEQIERAEWLMENSANEVPPVKNCQSFGSIDQLAPVSALPFFTKVPMLPSQRMAEMTGRTAEQHCRNE